MATALATRTAATTILRSADPARAPVQTLVVTRWDHLWNKPAGTMRSLRVVEQGAIVERIPGGTNYYVRVVYDGLRGYMDKRVLAVQGGEHSDPGHSDGGHSVPATATVPLEHRALPSASAAVLTVIPGGATVRRGNEIVDGFRNVTYHGIWGWAPADAID